MKFLARFLILFSCILLSSAGIFFPDDSMNGRMNCNFHKKDCKWSGADGWTWYLPEKSFQLDGPPLLDSSYDHALMVNYTDIRVNKRRDRLPTRDLGSPLITPNSNHSCFRFTYSIRVPNGPQNGLSLWIARDYNNSAQLLFNSGNLEDDRWYTADIDIIDAKYFRLHFKAYSTDGYIAIQAVKLDNGACLNPNRVCDFESDLPDLKNNYLCGWENESKNRIFKRTKASDISLKIKSDVTSKSSYGYVAVVEDIVQDQPVKLVSPVLTPEAVKDNGCFSFWSQRSHTSYSQLRLLRRKPDGQESVLWTTKPDFHPQNEWKRAQVKLNFSENIHFGDRLVLEASSEVNQAAIAVDDLKFQFFCESEVACRFQGNLCGWIHDETTSDLKWSYGEQNRVKNASRLSLDKKRFVPVPSTPSVGILYTDFTGAETGVRQKMELYSNIVDGRRGCAGLLFTVDDIGTDLSNSFRLDQVLLDGQRRTVWMYNDKEYGLTATWRPTQIVVPEADQPYRLVLHASSRDPSTRIGVDDISFTQAENACQTIVTGPTQAPKTQLEKVLRRLISDMLRQLRSDANRIRMLAQVSRDDPLNPAMKNIAKAIEKAMEIVR